MKVEIKEETREFLKTFPNVLMVALRDPIVEGDTIMIGNVQMVFTKDAFFFCMKELVGISERFRSAQNYIESYRAMGLDMGQNYVAKQVDAADMKNEDGKFNTENDKG